MSPAGGATPNGGRAPDPRPHRNRARALEVAGSLLVEQGWDAVTHVAVADRSGFGRTTLYRFWPDRVALLHDVIESEMPSIEITPTGDLRADLVLVLGRLAERINDPRAARLILTVAERAASSTVFADLRVRWHEEGARGVRSLIRAAVDSGELVGGVDDQDAVDLLSGPMVLRALFAGQAVTTEYVEQNVDRFLREFRSKESC